MARETRGSVAEANHVETTDTPTASKRKRQPSTSTDGPRGISLKVTLPAPAQTAAPGGGPRVRLNVSPTKVEEGGAGVKRQRISLKVKGSKKKGKADEVKADEDGDEPNGVDVEGKQDNGIAEEEGDEAELEAPAEDEEVKEESVGQKSVRRVLDKDVRDALAVVLARMAVNLPRPLNGILGLYLPPSFEQKPENTLGFILEHDLTWERLVELLHIFTTHLLQPCAYPSPFPPLAHIHTSIPPLPPHQPTHVIYDFCASVRDLVLSAEPGSDGAEGAKVEKWGLMMKVPGGTEGRGAGDWWTGIADWREMEKIKGEGDDEGEGESVLERLAGDGNKFGFAGAVSVTSLAGTSAGLATAPKLGDSLVRKASLKAQRWKEQLARRKGGFGSIQRPVVIPRVSSLPWTPSFAPTFDSNYAAGGVGYWTTLEAMHQRRRYKPWTDAVELKAVDEEVREGYYGSLEVNEGVEVNGGPEVIVVDDEAAGRDGKSAVKREVGEVLRDNAEWLDELLGWQEVRVRRGEKEPSEREQVLADELLESLSTLTSTLPPSSLLPSAEPGFANTLSKRLIPTSGPVIRGTLDPRRPRAIHDNMTIRPRPSATMPPIPTPGGMSNPPSIAQQLAGTPNRPGMVNGQSGGGYTPTPSTSYGQQASSQRPMSSYAYPGNSTSTNGASRQGYPAPQGSDYRQTPPPRPSYTHAPYHPGLAGQGSNSGNTIYSRSGPAQQQQQQQVMMSPSMGGSPLPSPGGMGHGYGQRPGMMPSGLRQSFGPDPGSGSQQGPGQVYFTGAGRG